MASAGETNGQTTTQNEAESENQSTDYQQAEPAGSAAAPDGLVRLLEMVAEKADPLVKLMTSYAESKLKRTESEARLHTRMAWIAVAVVGLVVITAAGLTYVDKVDGSTFTFLLGLIVGYVLTFIKDSIQPAE